jgi:hypothetical protein
MVSGLGNTEILGGGLRPAHGGLGMSSSEINASPGDFADAGSLSDQHNYYFNSLEAGGAANTRVAMAPWGHTAYTQTEPGRVTGTPLNSGNIEGSVPPELLRQAREAGGFWQPGGPGGALPEFRGFKGGFTSSTGVPAGTGGFDISSGQIGGLVGSLGLPILADLFGKDPKTKSRSEEALETGLSGFGSESTRDDPFSEHQMTSAGIM